MRNRRPSPEHEQAVARRLALLTAEWDIAKAVRGQDSGVRHGGARDAEARNAEAREAEAGAGELVPAGGEWPWNPPTRVAGTAEVACRPVVEVVDVDAIDGDALDLDAAPVGTEGERLENDAHERRAAEDGAARDCDGHELGPLVRAPGRHAARRGLPGISGRGGWAPPEWFISPLSGARGRLSSVHLTWVAVLVAVAFATTCWWMVQAKESEVLTPVSASFAGAESDGPQGPGATSPSGEKEAAPEDGAAGGEAGAPGEARAGETKAGENSARGGVEEVVVDVAGKVRTPGIVVLPAGSRVVDALAAAGGAKRGVDLTSLNLARRLVDGEQILVGKSPAAGVGAAPSSGVPSAPAGALVNLNSASQAELETLPGIGPVTAAAIVEWRERHGGFTAVEDLLEVDGIGEVTLERLAPLVSV